MSKQPGDQFINKVILTIYFTVIIFIITVFVYDWTGHEVQDSLINMFFALIMAELAALGTIKVSKTVTGNGEKNSDDPAEEEPSEGE